MSKIKTKRTPNVHTLQRNVRRNKVKLHQINMRQINMQALATIILETMKEKLVPNLANVIAKINNSEQINLSIESLTKLLDQYLALLTTSVGNAPLVNANEDIVDFHNNFHPFPESAIDSLSILGNQRIPFLLE